jgi:hypothetical protein
MDIVLGSAQLGNSDYGLFNKKKKTLLQIKKIEKLAFKYQVKFIDTAIKYGNSESIIGNSRLRKLKIITKIKLIKTKDLNNWLNQEISSCLKKLRVNKIYALLIHDYKDLMSRNGKKYLKILYSFKKKGIIQKIGISIYSPKELELIWKFWKPEIVQAPFNILDQRLLDSGWIKTLKKFKTKIFVRSCFLQGLLTNNYKSILKFKEYYPILNNFSNWCKKNNITNIKACLHFIKQFKKIDYLIVGFNNSQQLEKILKNFKEKQILIPNKFGTKEINLIDPRKWN